jgi:hypothetical protein
MLPTAYETENTRRYWEGYFILLPRYPVVVAVASFAVEILHAARNLVANRSIIKRVNFKIIDLSFIPSSKFWTKDARTTRLKSNAFAFILKKYILECYCDSRKHAYILYKNEIRRDRRKDPYKNPDRKQTARVT